MLYFFRLLVFVLGVFSGSAHALIAPVTTGSCQSSKPAHVPAEGTMVGGCGESTPTGNGPLTIVTTSHPSGGTCIAGALCGVTVQTSYSWSFTGVTECPANSAPSGGQCACNSGFLESGGQCINPDQACQSKSGTSSIVNVTVAWQRTPSVASGVDWLYPTKLSPSGTGSACNGGCMQNFDAHEPCSDCGSYVSQVPNSQGLYRVSIDFMGHYSGSACSDSPSDQVIKPDDSKDPPCPGFVGEVNGVKGCYGTADKPVRPESPDPNIDKNGKDKGNPAAGNKPSSGAGSGSGGAGRTPGAGSGGSAGGPAGAANGSGTKPDGTKPTEEGKEQQNCGAPGQPKCGIDESGTPKTYTGSDGLADWKAAVDSNRAQIKDSGGGVFDGFAIFFSAPPVASCSPFDLPNDYGSLDPCPVVDGVRGVMGYIWALGALFLCIGWIREAI